MDWLNPEEVREWLDIHGPAIEEHERRYAYAWEQFGLAVADAEIEYMPYGRLPPSVREVARLIRDCQGEKP